MKKINLFFGIVLSIVSVNPTAASSLQCNKDNFDACKTCEQLSKAIDLKNLIVAITIEGLYGMGFTPLM